MKSPAPVSPVTRELAAELDKAVWRVIEHRQDRVARLLVQTDSAETTVDRPADRAGSDRCGTAGSNDGRDELPGVSVGGGDSAHVGRAA